MTDAYGIVLWDLRRRRDELTRTIVALEALCSFVTTSKATLATTMVDATEEATATTGATDVENTTDASVLAGVASPAPTGIPSKDPSEIR